MADATPKKKKDFDLFDVFAVDVKAEEEGRWFLNVRPGLDLLVAREGNPTYQDRLGELIREEVGEDIDPGEAAPEAIHRASLRAVGERLLLGWRYQGEAVLPFLGESLEYSTENSVTIMTTPEMRDFANYVFRLARNAENFRKKRIEGEAKN
ncbi:MAG: hypothetical protein KKD77_21260 [Gammaproteobacteria bacterium]|nr:hypothetical protein [Gammaproteobacteria bacterium]